MKAAVRHPFHVRIFETVAAYPSGSYELEVMSFGCLTFSDAYEQGTRERSRVYHIAPGQTEERAHRAEYAIGCASCRCRGIQPGFKRKKCTVCEGRRVFPMPAITPREWTALCEACASGERVDDPHDVLRHALIATRLVDADLVPTADAVCLWKHANGEAS